MNPLFLEQKVLDWLKAQRGDMSFNSSDVLQGALDIELTEKTPETQRLFQMLRRSAQGRLQAYVTRGPAYEVSGQTRRPFIWHTRPQVPSPEPDFTELGRPDDLNDIRDRLARIEDKLNEILSFLHTWGDT